MASGVTLVTKVCNRQIFAEDNADIAVFVALE